MNIAVIGAGAWGTAFAIHLSRMGHTVSLVPRRFEQALALASAHENVDYLPGIPLPRSLQIGHELVPILMEAQVALLACPAQALRETARRVRDHRQLATELRLVISLAKGLEQGSHLRPSEVLAEVFPELVVGSLTGPTNAAEVARGQPAAMVLATNRSDPMVDALQAGISGPTLRVYTSEDLPGVEFGGCLKNIYAIAAGCCDGLELGDNIKAAMLTRALAEMVRVGTALGAQVETFYGLSGFGDLVATSNGEWSRNRQFGEQIGRGATVADLMAGRRTVVEGYKTAESFHGLCRERGIDAPILAEVYRILFEQKAPSQALHDLMTRGLKAERPPPGTVP
jgi:glycerol-3-phosphate dehydrogenase (NAD(P)+)